MKKNGKQLKARTDHNTQAQGRGKFGKTTEEMV
jgi:hypothetical protein